MKRVSLLQNSEQLLVNPGETFYVDVGWRNKGGASSFWVQAAVGNFDEPTGDGTAYWSAQTTVSLGEAEETLTSLSLWANVGIWDIIAKIVDPQTGGILAFKVVKSALKVAWDVNADISILAVANIGP